MYILKDNKKVFQLKANYQGVEGGGGGGGGRAPSLNRLGEGVRKSKNLNRSYHMGTPNLWTDRPTRLKILSSLTTLREVKLPVMKTYL